MKKYILTFSLFLAPALSDAAGWSAPLTVNNVETEGNSDVLIVYTSGGDNYTPGCTTNNWILSGDSEARRNRMYSTAMTALVSGKKLQFWYGDTCSHWSYHNATAVMLVK